MDTVGKIMLELAKHKIDKKIEEMGDDKTIDVLRFLRKIKKRSEDIEDNSFGQIRNLLSQDSEVVENNYDNQENSDRMKKVRRKVHSLGKKGVIKLIEKTKSFR